MDNDAALIGDMDNGVYCFEYSMALDNVFTLAFKRHELSSSISGAELRTFANRFLHWHLYRYSSAGHADHLPHLESMFN